MLPQQNGKQSSLRICWSIAALFATTLLLLLSLESCADAELPNDSAEASRFSELVIPLLKQHCYECHSHESESAEGGLVLDSRAGWKTRGRRLFRAVLRKVCC